MIEHVLSFAGRGRQGASSGSPALVRHLGQVGQLEERIACSAACGCDSSLAPVAVAPVSGPEKSQPAVAVAGRPTTTYTAFQGQTVTRTVWEGRNVAFLVTRTDLQPAVMARILNTFDRVYDFYAAATGREPTPTDKTTYNGKTTIAVVGATCGAGCGYLGFTGIEVIPQFFNLLYDGVRTQNRYDDVLFYEFGRNFWFFGDRLTPQSGNWGDSATTGYAVLMRTLSMRSVGVAGDKSGAEMARMINRYLADPSLNWNNTLAAGRAPANPLGLRSTDLFASFVLRLRDSFGGNVFIQKLWREVALRPVATTTQDGVDNLVVAASKAAGRNLVGLFATTWRWPVSDAARAEVRALFPA